MHRDVLIDALSPLGSLGDGVAGGEGAIYLWAKLPEGALPVPLCLTAVHPSDIPPALHGLLSSQRQWAHPRARSASRKQQLQADTA